MTHHVDHGRLLFPGMMPEVDPTDSVGAQKATPPGHHQAFYNVTERP
ncbi:hypothetical protein CFAEC_07810 [Corynebacterium faecale]|nr:hypothetical protein CFAEC_07810 [Corynebacterium faecale]